MFDVKKIVSKPAGLYDITNGIFVDFTTKTGNPFRNATCTSTFICYK